MRALAPLVGLSLLVACQPPPAQPPARGGAAVGRLAVDYLRSTLVPWPTPEAHGRLALTDPVAHRVAVYDSALVALVLIRGGARAEAAAIVEALLALQRPDGSLPFSFALPRPDDGVPYVRSGAVAWVGYAAAEYLDADRAGPARAEALALARSAARYVIARQVTAEGDPRDGLVRGGAGTYRYELDPAGRVRERLEPADIPWTSVEHNIDAFFFLRALARVTGDATYVEAAARIARGLLRAYSGVHGQLVRGVSAEGQDEVLALDCASWGSVFLGASGSRDRAETAASVADAGYAARDPRSGARGHRMQRRGPVLETPLLMSVLGAKLPAQDWTKLQAVWPEGSAGVALAALRVGRVERARAILEGLEPLRAPDGSLPTSTVDIPFLFDTRPSIAGTAWAELVRFELARPVERPTFWVP
ncbi:MAG TPA: hypothetical protein VLT33_51275 [Labilithrix sp.]|nr:hypothetical protein [Labilithrix sp.]